MEFAVSFFLTSSQTSRYIEVKRCEEVHIHPPSNMTSFLGIFIVSLLSWLFCVTIYRRYFSALSDIPGPFWASFSRLWHLSIIIQGNQNEQLAAAHENYGHFVRLANNEVSISHPDAVKRVLLATLEKVRKA